jgi:TolA-binding protein
MMRKAWLVICLVLALAGCGDRAKDLFETAQFEEKQTNTEHAGKLYRQIIDKYPKSAYAAQAKARLEALDK